MEENDLLNNTSYEDYEYYYDENYTSAADDCYYNVQFLDVKVWLVLCCGSLVSVISILQNGLLLFVFLRTPGFRSSHLFYMIFLAAFDILTAVFYLLLMSTQILMERLGSLLLSFVWHGYLRFLFGASNITLTSATYLIIAATTERYLTSTKKLDPAAIRTRHRLPAVLLALLGGLAFKGSCLFELEISENPECGNQNRYSAGFSAMAADPLYSTLFAFWVRNVATVFLPFFVLLWLNWRVTAALSAAQSNSIPLALIRSLSSGNSAFEKKGRKQIRGATRTMIMIVISYLLANILNIIVTAWEHIDRTSLYMYYSDFYTLAADVVSLLTVFCGTIRLEIFVYCNLDIRRRVGEALGELRSCCTGQGRMADRKYSRVVTRKKSSRSRDITMSQVIQISFPPLPDNEESRPPTSLAVTPLRSPSFCSI